MSIFYNVATIDISSGLVDHEISSGQDYFILLDAPTNANVTVKLNENTAPAIPIKEYWQFKSKDVQNIYLSCDAVSGESIKYGQADGNLEITTNPVINSIDTITSLTDVGASATNLDKIINPYEAPVITIADNTSSTSADMINISSLDCDKIRIKTMTESNGTNSYNTCYVELDGKKISINRSYLATGGWLQQLNDYFEIEGVRGKSLVVTADESGVVLEKFSLK